MSIGLVFTPGDDDASAQGTLVAVETLSAITTNISYLMDSMPIGSIIPVLEGLPGVPAPNPRIWQLCDGSIITEANSPCRGNPTPNLTGATFMRVGASPAVAGNIAGANTYNFSHSHGGFVSYGGNANTVGTHGNTYFNSGVHRHVMPPDLGSPDLQPVHMKINHYYKIL